MRAGRAIAAVILTALAVLGATTRSVFPRAGSAPPLLLDGYRVVSAPRILRFPRDHAAHPAYRTEWWYYTGRLAAGGHRFGYELTFFRQGMDTSWRASRSAWAPREIVLAHFAITDETGRRFRWTERAERSALGIAGADTSRYRVWIGDWSAALAADGRTHRLRAHDGDLAVALDLVPLRPPVVHGLGGVSRKGPAPEEASCYVSITRLASHGELDIGGRRYEVAGTSWMDHEFGTYPSRSRRTGWDWFGLRLDDGRDLMLYRLRLAGGGTEPASSGTLVGPGGAALHLPLSAWTLEETARWRSPGSGALYPSGWRLRVPGEGIDLTVRPTVADQELITSGSTGVTYWEGSARVEGTSGGRPVRGEGYVELTGYAGAPEF